jgi:hypothetical protein
MNIRSLIEDFTTQLSSLMEHDAIHRARAAVESALGGTRGGTAPKLLSGARRPKQLCPVPGCKNPAAPVFGMVCAKHKDISKAQIAKYREARRAKKVSGKKLNGKKGNARQVNRKAKKASRKGASRSVRGSATRAAA